MPITSNQSSKVYDDQNHKTKNMHFLQQYETKKRKYYRYLNLNYQNNSLYLYLLCPFVCHNSQKYFY